MNNKVELVFISAPGVGHLVSTLEFAKLMVARDNRLSITILIMNLPLGSVIDKHTDSLLASITGPIKLVHLPPPNPDLYTTSKSHTNFLTLFFETQKPHIRNEVRELMRVGSASLAGFIIDMASATMIDVANEFGVPSYLFYTSGAGFMGLIHYLRRLHDEHNKDITTEFKDSDTELVVPSFANPIPAKVVPPMMLDKEAGANLLLYMARRLMEAKGVIVNTFMELESHALNSLSDGAIPQVYPVGPLLTLEAKEGSNGTHSDYSEIMKWLDGQPQSSVVFLCFGSVGCFGSDQVQQIAKGLERCGHRFLWSLRKPPPKGSNMLAHPGEYADPDEILPVGFVNRTAEIGKVIGWAPQASILAHPSIGGFVSHCGWNSTLESLWYGVPVATWPLYSEQQLNAFQLVKDFELAVEIRLVYKKDGGDLVTADEIERGIRCVMEPDGKVRKKVKEMEEKSRSALMDGGSSNIWLGRLIHDIIDNVAKSGLS